MRFLDDKYYDYLDIIQTKNKCPVCFNTLKTPSWCIEADSKHCPIHGFVYKGLYDKSEGPVSDSYDTNLLHLVLGLKSTLANLPAYETVMDFNSSISK